MSADNGIYILRTKDQYRVAYFQNAGYMYCSAITREYNDKIIPSRAVELWGDCKFTRREDIALHLAHKWAESLPVCRYGVNIVRFNNTWMKLLLDAQIYAEKEIEAIKNNNDENNWNMKQLFKIAGGYYTDRWLHTLRCGKDFRRMKPQPKL